MTMSKTPTRDLFLALGVAGVAEQVTGSIMTPCGRTFTTAGSDRGLVGANRYFNVDIDGVRVGEVWIRATFVAFGTTRYRYEIVGPLVPPNSRKTYTDNRYVTRKTAITAAEAIRTYLRLPVAAEAELARLEASLKAASEVNRSLCREEGSLGREFDREVAVYFRKTAVGLPRELADLRDRWLAAREAFEAQNQRVGDLMVKIRAKEEAIKVLTQTADS